MGGGRRDRLARRILGSDDALTPSRRRAARRSGVDGPTAERHGEGREGHHRGGGQELRLAAARSYRARRVEVFRLRRRRRFDWGSDDAERASEGVGHFARPRETVARVPRGGSRPPEVELRRDCGIDLTGDGERLEDDLRQEIRQAPCCRTGAALSGIRRRPPRTTRGRRGDRLRRRLAPVRGSCKRGSRPAARLGGARDGVASRSPTSFATTEVEELRHFALVCPGRGRCSPASDRDGRCRRHALSRGRSRLAREREYVAAASRRPARRMRAARSSPWSHSIAMKGTPSCVS